MRLDRDREVPIVSAEVLRHLPALAEREIEVARAAEATVGTTRVAGRIGPRTWMRLVSGMVAVVFSVGIITGRGSASTNEPSPAHEHSGARFRPRHHADHRRYGAGRQQPLGLDA